jgi:hypothetical protein
MTRAPLPGAQHVERSGLLGIDTLAHGLRLGPGLPLILAGAQPLGIDRHQSAIRHRREWPVSVCRDGPTKRMHPESPVCNRASGYGANSQHC